MGEEKVWKCSKCDAEIKTERVVFNYMGRSFAHEVPVCPVCKKRFITKELAYGRMAEVEELMEDK